MINDQLDEVIERVMLEKTTEWGVPIKTPLDRFLMYLRIYEEMKVFDPEDETVMVRDWVLQRLAIYISDLLLEEDLQQKILIYKEQGWTSSLATAIFRIT